ncbi:winged helix-turn-helix domain-containing protein [Sulfolobus tengchongensis]|uniref:Winged helix-turn-helix domain-containing protein n=1 Tax=Sulfolobus tengchongensis TaxID=207809 RepID=A0AAX4L216_9CREN
MEERKRRSNTEIIYAILKGCVEGSGKTKLMYMARLNYPVFMKYISKLERLNLVYFDGKKYVITEKGEKVLGLLDKYMETYIRLSEIRKELEELL